LRDPTYNCGTALRIDVLRFKKLLGQSGGDWKVFFCERDIKPHSSKAEQKNTFQSAASFGKR
jgi:hypothetical protein